jgi:O-antigen ligase
MGRSARSFVAVVAVLVVFAELMLYGGDRREVALAFVLAQALGLCLLLVLTRWAPAELRRRRALLPLYLMFAGLVAWIGFQFAPVGQGMARSAWAAAGAPPAVTIDSFATLVELAKLLGLAAVFLVGVIVGGGERRSRAAFHALGLAAGAYAAWGVVGFYLGGWGGAMVRVERLSGSLLSPNTTAAVLGAAAIAGWAAILVSVRSALARERPLQSRIAAVAARVWPWVALEIVTLWALALTGSRGGAVSTLVGFVAASAAVVLARGGGARAGGLLETVAAATAGLLVAATAVFVSQGGFAARLRDYQIGMAGRTAYIDLYAGHLRDVPWTGFGLGTFARFNPLMLGPTAPARFWEFGAMHNVYLQWLYEAGVVGAALMFGCLAWAVGLVGWGLTRPEAGRRWTAAALGTSAMLAAHGLVDFDLQIHGVAALWALVLGAGVGAALRRAA